MDTQEPAGKSKKPVLSAKGDHKCGPPLWRSHGNGDAEKRADLKDAWKWVRKIKMVWPERVPEGEEPQGAPDACFEQLRGLRAIY